MTVGVKMAGLGPDVGTVSIIIVSQTYDYSWLIVVHMKSRVRSYIDFFELLQNSSNQSVKNLPYFKTVKMISI